MRTGYSTFLLYGLCLVFLDARYLIDPDIVRGKALASDVFIVSNKADIRIHHSGDRYNIRRRPKGADKVRPSLSVTENVNNTQPTMVATTDQPPGEVDLHKAETAFENTSSRLQDIMDQGDVRVSRTGKSLGNGQRSGVVTLGDSITPGTSVDPTGPAIEKPNGMIFEPVHGNKNGQSANGVSKQPNNGNTVQKVPVREQSIGGSDGKVEFIGQTIKQLGPNPGVQTPDGSPPFQNGQINGGSGIDSNKGEVKEQIQNGGRRRMNEKIRKTNGVVNGGGMQQGGISAQTKETRPDIHRFKNGQIGSKRDQIFESGIVDTGSGPMQNGKIGSSRNQIIQSGVVDTGSKPTLPPLQNGQGTQTGVEFGPGEDSNRVLSGREGKVDELESINQGGQTSGGQEQGERQKPTTPPSVGDATDVPGERQQPTTPSSGGDETNVLGEQQPTTPPSGGDVRNVLWERQQPTKPPAGVDITEVPVERQQPTIQPSGGDVSIPDMSLPTQRPREELTGSTLGTDKLGEEESEERQDKKSKEELSGLPGVEQTSTKQEVEITSQKPPATPRPQQTGSTPSESEELPETPKSDKKKDLLTPILTEKEPKSSVDPTKQKTTRYKSSDWEDSWQIDSWDSDSESVFWSDESKPRKGKQIVVIGKSKAPKESKESYKKKKFDYWWDDSDSSDWDSIEFGPTHTVDKYDTVKAKTDSRKGITLIKSKSPKVQYSDSVSDENWDDDSDRRKIGIDSKTPLGRVQGKRVKYLTDSTDSDYSSESYVYNKDKVRIDTKKSDKITRKQKQHLTKGDDSDYSDDSGYGISKRYHKIRNSRKQNVYEDISDSWDDSFGEKDSGNGKKNIARWLKTSKRIKPKSISRLESDSSESNSFEDSKTFRLKTIPMTMYKIHKESKTKPSSTTQNIQTRERTFKEKSHENVNDETDSWESDSWEYFDEPDFEKLKRSSVNKERKEGVKNSTMRNQFRLNLKSSKLDSDESSASVEMRYNDRQITSPSLTHNAKEKEISQPRFVAAKNNDHHYEVSGRVLLRKAGRKRMYTKDSNSDDSDDKNKLVRKVAKGFRVGAVATPFWLDTTHP